MGGPYRNQQCPPGQRDRAFNKKVLAEIARGKEIWNDVGSGTYEEKLRDYLYRTQMDDHVTFYTTVCVLFGRRPLPRNTDDLWEFKKLRDQVSTKIGDIMDHSNGICIGRDLHDNPETGDREYVLFNAKKEEEIKKQREARDQFAATMAHRTEKRTTNVKKPARERKKIMREEQLQNAGTT